MVSKTIINMVIKETGFNTDHPHVSESTTNSTDSITVCALITLIQS
jgi:hypothetical protein